MRKLLTLFGIILSIALYAQPGSPDANGIITPGPPWVTGISTGGGEMELQLEYVYSGQISVKSYNVIGDGSTDDAAAIQSALDVAGDALVVFPTANYRINSTIECNEGQRIDFNGSTLYGSSINDGSPMISIPSGIDGVVIKNGTLQGDATNFDCNGLFIGQNIDVTTTSTNNIVDNMWIYYCDTAFFSAGWQNGYSNINIRNSNYGAINKYANSSYYERFDLRQNHVKDFDFYRSSVFHLDSWVIQNSIAADTIQESSRINYCDNVEINTMYFESSNRRDSSWLVIGDQRAVQSVEISGVRYQSDNDYYVPAIKGDSIDNIKLSGYFGSFYIPPFQGTSNTKGIDLDVKPLYPSIIDNSDNLGPAYNYMPNGSFEHWFAGWNLAGYTGVTVEQESDTVKTGFNSLKIQGANGTSQGFIDLIIDQNVDYLQGKEMTLSGWMYVPDEEWFQGLLGSRTVKCGMQVRSYNGSTYSDGTLNTTYAIPGAWNYIKSDVTIQTDATRVYFRFYLSYNSTALTTDMFVLFDGVQLFEQSVPESRVINSSLPDAPTIAAKVNHGRLEMWDVSVTTDSDLYYNVGDVVWDAIPTSGGDIGWVCITAGAGGTATFQPFGPID